MSHVVKVRKELLPQIKNNLLRSQQIHELPPTNQYETFRLKFRDEIIVAYTTGKIVATGSSAETMLSSAITGLHQENHQQITIGSDEAGKGEWLGPLVVAAVALTPEQGRFLTAKGIMDSKLLKLDGIRRLAKVVKDNSLGFRLVTVPPVRFNELMMDAKDEGKSLNDILAWAHALAIKNVSDKIQKEGLKVRVVIDEFDKLKTENRLWRVINKKDFEVLQYHRAEEETAVAAASILARDERELWIDGRNRTENLNLREINSSEALRNSKSFYFAKITYLKQGKSDNEVLTSTILQQTITIEYMLRKLAETFAINTQGQNFKEIVRKLGEQNVVTQYLVNDTQQVMHIRDQLVHGLKVEKEELGGASDLSSYVISQLRKMLPHSEKGKKN